MKMKFVVALLVVLSICLLIAGCGSDSLSSPQSSYPIDTTVVTTLEKTILPVDPPVGNTVMPNDVENYARYGYGVWASQPGIGYVKKLDLMPSGYAAASQTVTNSASLFRFFTMTDIHLTDVQSPASVMFFGLGLVPGEAAVNSAYSPVIPYTTQVLDAAVQTVNALHRKQPLDIGLFLGDAINLGQHNELRWYIDILDGKTINPNSDPQSTATTDFMRPFKAAGLDATLKWYQVLGNHDHFWSGMLVPNDKIKQTYVGGNILNIGDLMQGNGLDSTGYYTGVMDGYSPFGKVILAGPQSSFATPPKINANPARKFVPRSDWISEFFTTTSYPIGHGFSASVTDPDLAACYSFEPKGSALPLKVIVLDNTEPETITGPLGANGYLNQTRFDWLKNELREGEQNGKLMIVAAHVPIGVNNKPPLWDPAAPITESALITELNKYSNLILWVAGHRHFNTVTPMLSPDPSKPEFGFWEVETSSLRDFPQQFRTFDIVRNSDNTISIFATNVDPAVRAGTPAATSRSMVVAAYQIFNGATSMQNKPTGSLNVELVKQLSLAMQIKIQKYGSPIIR